MPRNIGTKTTFERLSGLLNTYYAKKTDLPTKLSDLTNDGGFISETTIDEKISAAVSGALIPGGSVLFANLPALAKANCNHMYNVEDAFTTTADFLEGAGKAFPAGTNVAIINTCTSSSPVYKYDTYTGTVDYSVFMQKQTSATQGNFAMFDANGQAVDAGVGESDFIKQHQDISGKADKDTDAVEGNFAAFDSNGNPVDSGHSHSDYLTAHQDISSKADKPNAATQDNLAAFDSSKNPVDSGIAKADVQQKLASGAFTENNVRTTDANGFAKDSGVAIANVLVAADISDYTEAELRTLLGLPAAE